jgi:hypothetical protein
MTTAAPASSPDDDDEDESSWVWDLGRSANTTIKYIRSVKGWRRRRDGKSGWRDYDVHDGHDDDSRDGGRGRSEDEGGGKDEGEYGEDAPPSATNGSSIAVGGDSTGARGERRWVRRGG